MNQPHDFKPNHAQSRRARIAPAARRSAERILSRHGLRLTRSSASHLVRMLQHAGVDLVLDVGAAKGFYGAELRSRGYEGSIVSFEPLRLASVALEQTARNDPKWLVRNIALGNENGTATMNVASNSDSSSLLPMLTAHRMAVPEITYVKVEEVQLSRLDDIFPQFEHLGSRFFLKLDAQGFERKILEGATNTLRNTVGIQIELSFVPLYAEAMMYDEALQLLASEGFVPTMMFPAFTSRFDGRWLQADAVLLRD